jgi:hypothetical protein
MHWGWDLFEACQNPVQPQTIIQIAILAILIAICYGVYRPKPIYVPIEVERHVADVMREVTKASESLVEEVIGSGRPARIRYTARLILEAKAEFGLLKNIEANRLMVRKWMRDTARAHGLRNIHIATMLDSTVSLFFLPSDHDIVTGYVGYTDTATMQVARHEQRFSTRSGRGVVVSRPS